MNYNCSGVIKPVAYWPRPSCQKKKCTCVNNRCIRSNISGDEGRPWLSRGWIEWAENNDITRGETGSQAVGVQISWREDAGMRTISHQGLSLQAPGWAAQENRKERVWYPEEWGVNMLQSLFSLQLTSHTIIPFVNLSNYFNKVRGIYCVRSSLLRRYISACICVCIVVHGYKTNQTKPNLTRCALLHSVCNLKVAQMNMQRCLIREFMLYEFKVSHNWEMQNVSSLPLLSGPL